jgi:excisionase family DNA binding protein
VPMRRIREVATSESAVAPATADASIEAYGSRESAPPFSASFIGSQAPANQSGLAPVVDVTQLPFFLTVDEAAAPLRTTRRAIYARADRGLLAGVVRDGRRVLVHRDDLLRSLSESRAASPGSARR